ncbi:hypothetical protein BGZ65_009197, partial [Modicella reniformis]
MVRFTRFFPATLARIQSGLQVNLRDGTVKTRGSFDLRTTNLGQVVLPTPIDQKKWTLPNGCSLRSPLSTSFQDVVESFDERDTFIFIIDKGTPIPKDLVLILERGDHFSFQCARSMTLQELNDRLTKFLETRSMRMTKDVYQTKYPAGEMNDYLD